MWSLHCAGGQSRGSVVPTAHGERRREGNRHARRLGDKWKAASCAGGIHRGTNIPVRLLLERLGDDDQSAARQEPFPHGRRNAERISKFSVPVWKPRRHFRSCPAGVASREKERIKPWLPK